MHRGIIRALAVAASAAVGTAAFAAPREPETARDRFERTNAAQGFQAGSWRMLPSASLRGGYDDNLTLSPDAPVATAILILRGRIDAARDDGADSASAYVAVGGAFHEAASDFDYVEGGAGAAFSVAFDEAWRLRGSIDLAAGAEGPSSGEGVVIGGTFDRYEDLATFQRASASLGLRRDVGSLYVALALDGAYSRFDARRTASGLEVEQDFRNGLAAEAGLRVGYRFSPALSVFLEGAGNLRRYDDSSADSSGWRAAAGVQAELTRLLTGEIFAGYAQQSYDTGGSASGLTYGASLRWFATDFISVALDARREFDAERLDVASGAAATPVTRDRVALRVDYDPLETLLIYAGAEWRRDDYDCLCLQNETVTFDVGAEWALNQVFRLSLDYRHERSDSDTAGAAERNRVMLGVRAQY